MHAYRHAYIDKHVRVCVCVCFGAGPAAFSARALAEPHDASNYLMGSKACALQGDYMGAIAFLQRCALCVCVCVCV